MAKLNFEDVKKRGKKMGYPFGIWTKNHFLYRKQVEILWRLYRKKNKKR